MQKVWSSNRFITLQNLKQLLAKFLFGFAINNRLRFCAKFSNCSINFVYFSMFGKLLEPRYLKPHNAIFNG